VKHKNSGLRNGFLLALIFLVVGLSACSSKTLTPVGTDQPTLAPEPTFTPTGMPHNDDWEESLVKEGTYGRNEYCPISFSYQSRSAGLLTVAISDTIPESAVNDEIYRKIFERYDQLAENSPIDFDHSLMVVVIPEANIENCIPNNGVVFTSPDRLDSVELAQGMVGASTNITEHWVRFGLEYLASGEEIDDQVLKEWYEETEDLDISGLFVARFKPDWVSPQEVEIARMTAASLIRYCIDEENLPIDSLGKEINNDLRTQWLNSIGVERTADYAYDHFYEAFYEISYSENCSLLLKSRTMNFCLNRLGDTPFPFFDEVHEAENFTHRAYTTQQAVTDYLFENAPSIRDKINTEGKITIEVSPLEVSLGTIDGNIIKVHNYGIPYYVSSMMIMTYDWYDDLYFNNDEGLLLQNGFAEYLGTLIPIYEQPRKTIVWEDINGLESSPGISFWYFLDADQLETAKTWYLQQGGSLVEEEAIDLRLFTDAVAYATMDRGAHGGPLGMSIGYRAQHINPGLDLSDMVGLELSYTQAASYVAWLCDTYSLDSVMAKYVNKDTNTALEGMDYESLKQAWLDDLKARGEDIPIPSSP
jgi:hypothetical protein